MNINSRWGKALDVGQIDVDEHEHDEHVHHEVMDDAHRHETTDQRGEAPADAPIHGGNPQAKTREEHEDDQQGDQQVADLLRNTELCSKRMILLDEQVVLDPFESLMTVVLLGSQLL